MRKVFIVNGNNQYVTMFKKNGWNVTDDIREADLVQFCGGEDVTPGLYGEDKHPHTFYSVRRDQEEERVYQLCVALKKPMVGICRGGQFLNVMCGGKMWQHTENHAIHGTHHVCEVKTGQLIACTSTHHQMMKPHQRAHILGVASEASKVEQCVDGEVITHVQPRGTDVEVVLYEEDNVLCFQPHPEYLSQISACQGWYFELIREHLIC